MANTPEWVKPRSAVIPMIIDNDGIKVVLVTTQSGKHWIFPKGQIELGMTPYDSAAKEAYEEAGVQGQINPALFDQYVFEKWGGCMTVKVYTMSVTTLLEQWPEMRNRQRQILPIQQAIEIIQEKQKPALLKLKTLF